MSERFRVLVADGPDSEDLVVEVWLDDVLVCSIEGNRPDFQIRFYPTKQEVVCDVAAFQSALKSAIERAAQIWRNGAA
jgi:hypothetical protein